MAIKITLESFLAVLRRSNLIEAEQIKRLTDEFRAANGEPPDAKPFADYLVQQKQITAWQAEKLLMGKHKGFFLGRYKLKGLLGKGGMSSVYLAEHVLMRRMCALKVLPARRVNDASYLGRFHREAQAVAALDHPNIVRAYDVDHEEDGEFQIHFLVMEYVEGKSLLDLVTEKGPARPTDAADWIRQAALGLEHAHRAGIIHRDIKPGNLLLDNGGTIKLLDMGLARFFGGEDSESLTIQHDEKVLGTADYLAPEQAVDSHKVDRRADIYSLGCSLYFLLTGHPPFNAGTLAQRLMAHQMKEPPDVTAKRSDVPDSLVAIMKKMMAKLPDHRYATAGEAAEALATWLESQGVATAGGSDSGRMRRPEDSGAIKAAPTSEGAPRVPPPSTTPAPTPGAKVPTPPAPTAEEGFAALGDLFGQMSEAPVQPAAPQVAAEPRGSNGSTPPPAAPVDDDVPAFLRGGPSGGETAGGFANLFEAGSSPPSAPPAPKPPAVRPAAAPAKGVPAKAAPKAASPAPAAAAAGGDDVPDFLRMGSNGPAQAETFINPFADAGGPSAASPPPAPKKAAPSPPAAAKPAAKAPPKGKPASPAPPRAAAPSAAVTAPPVTPVPPAADDVPDFLKGNAGGGVDGDAAGSGGFADLFSDQSSPPATAATPPAAPARPATRPAAAKPAAKPAPKPAAQPAAAATPAPAAEEIPAFLSGGGAAAEPMGDLFTNAFEDPSASPAPPAAATPATSAGSAPAVPTTGPADDVPDFLNPGPAAAAAEAGGIPDLFGETVVAPPAAPSAPPATAKKPAPASPAKTPVKTPAKAAPAPAPVAESDVPDFLKGSPAPPASDGGFPDFLGAASAPQVPPPAPPKAQAKPGPQKAAAPAKGAAPTKPGPKPGAAASVKTSSSPASAPPSDIPDFLAGVAGPPAAEETAGDLFGLHSAEQTSSPVSAAPPAAPTPPAPPPPAASAPASSPPPAPQENVPAFLAEEPAAEAAGTGTDDLFGFGAPDAPEPKTEAPKPAVSTGSPATDDSPFGETIMAEPDEDAPAPAVADNPFGESSDAPATVASAPRPAAAKKPGGANAAQAWLKVRRNQIIAGSGAAALLAVVLAIALWPKSKAAPANPGAAPVAATLPSAAQARGAKPPGRPQGETYTVGPTGDFGTVTEAVSFFIKNAPADGSRRTIRVAGGYWYGEAIAVSGIGLSSPLTITSDASTPAVLRPAGGRPILNLPLANGLVLENLVFDAGGAQGCLQIESLGADSRLSNVEFRNFREFGMLTEAVSAEDATKPVILENCRFLGGAAGAKGLLVKTSTSTLFGLTIRQSQFQAPMRTGIEFGAGALGNVTVSQCRFVDVKTGLYFSPPKQDIADLLLLNNTFYRTQEAIVFNQAPAGSPQGMKSAVVGNLFVPPAVAPGSPDAAATTSGGDFIVRAGLTTQNWDAFIKGGPGIAGNMTARGGEVGPKEVDIFSAGGGRRGVADAEFESVTPGAAGFLKPTFDVSFAPPKVGEPHAGAVAP